MTALKKTITLSVAAITAAAFAVHTLAEAWTDNDKIEVRSPVPVVTTTIKMQDSYLEWRSFTGRVTSGRTSPLGFELAGSLKSVSADIGTTVKKGAVLASLDTSRLKANLDRLKAEKSSAQAALKLAERTLERSRETYGQGHASAQRLDEAEARRNQAVAQINTLDASISAVKIDIAKSSIIAPFGGVVTERKADEGQIMGAGMPIFTLVETGALEAHIGVAPTLATALESGMNYRLLDAERKDIIGAKIRNILPVIEGQTRTRMTIFTLPDGSVRDGDLITLIVQDKKIATGAWVPLRALSSDVRGLWRLSKVTKKDGETRIGFESVQILYTTGRMAYVTGTLSEGDQIVAGGVNRLAHQERVKVVKQVTPDAAIASGRQ